MKKLFKQLFIFGLTLLINATLHAQSCVQVGPNSFTCGIPTNDFNNMKASSLAYGNQVQSNWCWAACVQMVLNYHGLQVNQVDVVTRIYGSPYVNQAAAEPQILTALSGWAPNSMGGYSTINALGGFTSVQEIITGLSKRLPLIVGMTNPSGGVGHAYVLTAINYSNQYDSYGNVIGVVPNSVVLRNPWPGSPSREEFTWAEFQARCMMSIKVWIS
jgi:hypothetical protein